LLNQAGVYLWERGRCTAAESLSRRVLEMQEKALGPEHPDVAGCLNNLAGLYDSQARYERAEPLYVRALTILGRR
jgi:tetratricopeptide (TPR) repeat protein